MMKSSCHLSLWLILPGPEHAKVHHQRYTGVKHIYDFCGENIKIFATELLLDKPEYATANGTRDA